ncbi:MAG: hypothetical protein ACRD3D_08695 [Terriglobia bacterium]
MNIAGTSVQFRLTPGGERALRDQVPGGSFTAFGLDTDFAGVWILPDPADDDGNDTSWPSLFIRWDFVETLRAVFIPSKGVERAPIGFRPQS